MPCHSTQDTLLCVHAGEHVTPHLRLSSSSADALRTVTPRVGAGGSSEAGEGGGGVARPCAHHFDDRCAVLAGMGDAAASACIMQLAGSPPTPTSGIFSRANREDAYKALVRRERETFGSNPFDGGGGFDVWPEDCEYLVMGRPMRAEWRVHGRRGGFSRPHTMEAARADDGGQPHPARQATRRGAR